MENQRMMLVEGKIRKFLTDELMKERASLASYDEPLDIESVDQVELRLFLEEEFGVKADSDIELLDTIGAILEFVAKHQHLADSQAS